MSPDLLCERCGYVIDGLDVAGTCPECGESVRASHPAARPGSPWQQKPSFRAWSRTLGALIRSPRRLFSVVCVDARRCRSLLSANLVAAGLFFSLTLTYAMWQAQTHPKAGTTDRALTSLLTLALGWFAAFWGLWLLTRIEWLGIRLIGRQRLWRVTPRVAFTVCAHASYGWIGAGLLSSIGLLLGAILFPTPNWANLRWTVLLSLAGSFAGLLVFETLIYAGIRICRFANPPANESALPDE